MNESNTDTRNEDETDGDGYGNTLDVDFDDADTGEGLGDPNDPDSVETTEIIEDGDTDTEQASTASPTTPTTENTVESGTGTVEQNDAEKQDIPHRVRSESPKDERVSINMFVGEDEKRRLKELKRIANDEFDETVYQIDVYLAVMRSSMYDEAVFLDALRDMGYGYFN